MYCLLEKTNHYLEYGKVIAISRLAYRKSPMLTTSLIMIILVMILRREMMLTVILTCSMVIVIAILVMTIVVTVTTVGNSITAVKCDRGLLHTSGDFTGLPLCKASANCSII